MRTSPYIVYMCKTFDGVKRLTIYLLFFTTKEICLMIMKEIL